MDPASAMLLFVLFQATEKVIGYAGGKIADSMSKPIWDALEEKAKWISGGSDTTKRWQAFSLAFDESKTRLEIESRHPTVAKQVMRILAEFDSTDVTDKNWLSDISAQLEKASLVSEKPDECLLIELFTIALPNARMPRAELSETLSDFVKSFQDALFAQPAYQELMLRRAWWENLRQPNYDTRERYISQLIYYNENLDFIGIPELKDRQALRIEDVFISLQTELEKPDNERAREAAQWGQLKEELGLIEWTKPGVRQRLSITDALRENQKLVILGDPGAGKTTLLKYILLAYAENRSDKLGLQEDRLPIFIRLYDYVTKREECGKEGFSFTDYLNKFCTDHLQIRLPPDFFAKLLERGGCCVCLDGLDELGATGIRREITTAVSAMANRYPRNRFIVTSRVVGYEEAPLDRSEFAHHRILPLSNDDVQLFVEKWYKAREKDVVARRERTEHLVKTIMDEPRIQSLASNPLILTIIALVHRIEAELPHERVKLYDKCVTTLVETWDRARGMKTVLRRRLLEKIAYWMHSSPGEKGRTREVRDGNLRLQLVRFLQSDPKLQLDDDQIQTQVEDFIRLVQTRSGLLVERGEGVYTFSHLTFQEYLAACDIEKRLVHSTNAIWDEIRPRLQDPHWREVILLLLGSLNRFEQHNSELVRRIYESSDNLEPILHRYLFLAAEALSDRVEVDVLLRKQIMEDLLKAFTSDERARDDAFRFIGSMQDDAYLCNRLRTIAEDHECKSLVRMMAGIELGKLGHKDQATSLLVCLAEDENIDDWLRVSAAHALAKVAHEEVPARLLLGFVRDPSMHRWDRARAAEELGGLAHVEEPVSSALIQIAEDAIMDGVLRVYVAQALVELGRREEGTRILLELARDKNTGGFERRLAASAIALLGYEGEAAILLEGIAADENNTGWVRISAAESFGQLGHKAEAAAYFLRLAADEKLDSLARCEAAESLAKWGHEQEGRRWLLRILEDENAEDKARRAAAVVLGRWGVPAEMTMNTLLRIVKDEKVAVGVRSYAAEALGRLGHQEEAALFMRRFADDPKMDPEARASAAEALGDFGHRDEATALLLTILQDSDVPEDSWASSSAYSALQNLVS